MAETKLKGVFIMRLFRKNEIGFFDDLYTAAFFLLSHTSVNLELIALVDSNTGIRYDEYIRKYEEAL